MSPHDRFMFVVGVYVGSVALVVLTILHQCAMQ